MAVINQAHLMLTYPMPDKGDSNSPPKSGVLCFFFSFGVYNFPVMSTNPLGWSPPKKRKCALPQQSN